MGTIRRLLSRTKRLAGKTARTRAAAGPSMLDRLQADPTLPMRELGIDPDPWQTRLITSPARRVNVLCTRRSGKSFSVACRTLARLVTRRSRVLVFAPSIEQSREVIQYVREMNEAIGSPVPLVRDSLTELAWANGSRIKAKADRQKSSRGFTPDLVIIDEAAQVSDELYLSVRPMMVLGKCEFMILSTPFGQLGWFHDIWNTPEKLARWDHFKVTAYEVPRICETPEFAEDEALMPRMWFDQEYKCMFNRAVDAVFDGATVDRMVVKDDEYEPLTLGV